MGIRIKGVSAEERLSPRGWGVVVATVITDDGAIGTGRASAGVSVGEHEPVHLYDGDDRLHGRGVLKAVENVNTVIATELKGMDVTHQQLIDAAMLRLDGTQNKSRLGANAILSVSQAVLNAATRSVELPLYRYIGGLDARTIPISASHAMAGSTRYGGPAPGKVGGGKPSYCWITYGTRNFEEVLEASTAVQYEFRRLFQERYGIECLHLGEIVLSRGVIEHDNAILDVMVDSIGNTGYDGKIGIYMDVAAGCFLDEETGIFVGLFSEGEKTKEDLIEYYKEITDNYPVVILEDPLDEEDYEGHTLLTKELGIEILGDDLFTTNIDRLRYGIERGAANAILIKTRQSGTVTEAIDVIKLAQKHGYAACQIGEPDMAVGMNTGQGRLGGPGSPAALRLIEIEKELGDRAVFLGKAALKLG
jgi:enolase